MEDALRFVRAQWDRAGAVLAVVVGVVLLLVGWIRASGTAYPAEQIPLVISGGLGGIFSLGIGAMLWISADLRDEWRKLDALERAVTGRSGADPARPPDPGGPGTPEAPEEAEAPPSAPPRRRRTSGSANRSGG